MTEEKIEMPSTADAFKVGDRVRVVAASYPFVAGDTGVVVDAVMGAARIKGDNGKLDFVAFENLQTYSAYASTAEYLTWDDAQSALKKTDAEMNALVGEGKLKAYRRPGEGEGSPMFKRADVEGFKGGAKPLLGSRMSAVSAVKATVDASGVLTPGIEPEKKRRVRWWVTDDPIPGRDPNWAKERIASLERRLAKLRNSGQGTQRNENDEDALVAEIKRLKSDPGTTYSASPSPSGVKAADVHPDDVPSTAVKPSSVTPSVWRDVAALKSLAKLLQEIVTKQPANVSAKSDLANISERIRDLSGYSAYSAASSLPGGAYAAPVPTSGTIEQGSGYWDTTAAPIGVSFHRAPAGGLKVTNIEPLSGKVQGATHKGRTANGTVAFDADLLVERQSALQKERDDLFGGAQRYAASQSIPGGAYASEQAADESWTVRDVPIFAEHEVPLADGKRSAKVDGAWLAAAVEKASSREAGDKYLAPVHVRHHGGAQPTEPAGFFRPTRVGRMKYEGRTVAVLFADLLGVPDATYQEMRLGHLPYRSVEVHDIGKPEVNSLALLQDEVPFFRLPMLTIGAERPAVTRSVAASAAYAPLLAYAECGTVGSYLYSEASMRKYAGAPQVGDVLEIRDQPQFAPRKKKVTAIKDTLMRVTDLESGKDEGWMLIKNAMKGSAMPDDIKPEDEDAVKAAADKSVKAAAEGGEPTLADVMACCQECLAVCKECLAACKGEEEDILAAAPEDAPAVGTPAIMQAISGPDAVALAAVARLDAKLTAQAGTIKTLTAEREVARLIELGIAETRGLAVGDDFEATVRKYAAKGEPAVRIYLDAVKGFALKDPPDEGAEDAAEDLPEEVRKYEAKGPATCEQAAKYSAEFDAQHGRTSLTRERYIAAAFLRDAATATTAN